MRFFESCLILDLDGQLSIPTHFEHFYSFVGSGNIIDPLFLFSALYKSGIFKYCHMFRDSRRARSIIL